MAAILAATRVSNTPLKEHRVAVLGAGSAGCGISEQLVQAMVAQGLNEQEARQQFFLVDRFGLVHDGINELLDFQKPLAHKKEVLKKAGFNPDKPVTLSDVIHLAKPTILLGVSGQPNQFTEAMVKEMHSYCERPIIFPLSNPTSRAEAVPKDLLRWTEGQALIASGSPFDPVDIAGKHIEIAQCNNSYIFPGMGLAVVAGHARRVTDNMMMAAAVALSELSPATKTGEGRLLPELTTIRTVSKHIAKSVIQQGILDGHIDAMTEVEIDEAIDKTMWYPNYETYQPA